MKYFSIAELSHSSAATKLHIDNTPDKEATQNLETLVAHILDPAREQLGMPIMVNSSFRSQLVNRCVGGNPSSQHLRGELPTSAARITTDFWESSSRYPTTN